MKKYSLGLDLGSNSVGWALVDENNNIVKKNGKSLWGVRMFDEASDASDRRAFRSARRRIKRRNERISLLRDLFSEEIYKIDSTFFQRLDDSFFKKEDKRNKNTYTLFNDENYTDKDYFDEYPTIYHLRKKLISCSEKVDIRMVYLAIHHIIKYRGNFLYPGDEFNLSNIDNIINFFEGLNSILIDYQQEYEDDSDYFETIEFKENFYDDLKKILLSKFGIAYKKKELLNLFGVNKKTFVNEFLIALLSGSDVSVNKLTLIKNEDYEPLKLTYKTETLEVEFEEAARNITEISSLIEYMIKGKDVVDYYFLLNLLNVTDENTQGMGISEAMVNKYNKHKDELKELKSLIRSYLPEKYNDMFRNINVKDNYVNYIGMNNTAHNMVRFAHAKREDFYKYVKKILDQIKDKDALYIIDDIKNKIDNNDYLLRENSDQNGVFPKQLHQMELKAILNNQSKYYPFLSSTDDSGISVSEKILAIFNYKVPYYVGPLNNNSKYSWVIKNKDEKIYPWNFDECINHDETAIQFIKRMQNKCTYLKGIDDYCLPKNSIIFSEYNCLAYLNKLYINGSPITYECKIEILNDLFKTKRKPTRKTLEAFIKARYGNSTVVTTSNSKDLEEINCDMSSYIIFKNIFKDDFDNNLDVIENIINDIVIFEDKKILERRLRNYYNLDNATIKEIKCINFTGYSSLSRRFINGLEMISNETGELLTLLEVMRRTNLNLQQILYSPEYNYIDVVNNYNSDMVNSDNSSYQEFIDENLYVSPIMKRPMIQAYAIIEELEKIIGQPIDKYYVECTRTNKEKKVRTKSRYEKVKEIYSSARRIALDLNIDMNYLEKKLEENKDKLQSDKIYLYFTQLGKCMYTMENIDFDDLFDNYKYDIDHIYPQSLIKDDSFSNRVLTRKDKNNAKSDKFIFELDNFLSPKMRSFYDILVSNKLISKEKYKRLTKKEIDMSELDSFVNRQIVATNQAVKALTDLLKIYKKVPAENIIYSKAEVVSDFRKQYDVIKSRTANNFHHAHDAYLNVVIGGAVDNYYKLNRFFTIKDYYHLKNERITINPMQILSKNREYNGKLIWDKDKTIALIKKNIYNRFDIMETTRTFNTDVLFGKVTILDAKNGNVPVSLKDARADVTKYGGIKQYAFSKYTLIKVITKKGDIDYILESIPAVYHNNTKMYLNKIYSDYSIIIDNLKINTVLKIDNRKFCITGKSGSSYLIKNLNDRIWSYEAIKAIKEIDKYKENLRDKRAMEILEDRIIIAPAKNKYCHIIELTNDELGKLYSEIIAIFSKKIYNYSNILSIREKLPINLNSLSIQDKISVISELLILLKTNERGLANLELVGLSKNSGLLTINKKLSQGTKIIIESVTGYYQKVLFEVK